MLRYFFCETRAISEEQLIEQVVVGRTRDLENIIEWHLSRSIISSKRVIQVKNNFWTSELSPDLKMGITEHTFQTSGNVYNRLKTTWITCTMENKLISSNVNENVPVEVLILGRKCVKNIRRKKLY